MREEEQVRISRVGTAIASARAERGIAREDLARRLSQRVGEVIPLEAVSAWEFGRNLPRVTLLPEIEDLLGMAPGRLAGIVWSGFRPAEPAPPPAPTGSDRLVAAYARLGRKGRRLVTDLAESLAGSALAEEPAAPADQAPERPARRTRAASTDRQPTHILRRGKRDAEIDVAALRRYREAAGVTHADIAAELELPVELIAEVESGRRNPVQGLMRRAIANAVNVPEEWIEPEVEYPPIEELRGWPVNSMFLVEIVRLLSSDGRPHWSPMEGDEYRRRIPWPKDEILAAAGIPMTQWEAVEFKQANLTLHAAVQLGKVTKVHHRAFLWDPAVWGVPSSAWA